MRFLLIFCLLGCALDTSTSTIQNDGYIGIDNDAGVREIAVAQEALSLTGLPTRCKNPVSRFVICSAYDGADDGQARVNAPACNYPFSASKLAANLDQGWSAVSYTSSTPQSGNSLCVHTKYLRGQIDCRNALNGSVASPVYFTVSYGAERWWAPGDGRLFDVFGCSNGLVSVGLTIEAQFDGSATYQ